jgi:membrane protease YdiL (CAAX protease family)
VSDILNSDTRPISGRLYRDFASRGRNDWWLYLLTAAITLVGWSVLVTAIVIALLLARLMSSGGMTAVLSNPSNPAFFIANGLAFATILLVLAPTMRLLQRKRLADVLGSWNWKLFAVGIGLWTACLLVATASDFLIDRAGFRWTGGPSTLPLAVAALFGLGAQTFAEEFVFRGWLTQGLLLATKRPLPAAILSGLLFGAIHIPNGIPQAVNAACSGVIASLIAIRTGGIAFTWGMHLINNLFSAVIVVSAADVFKGSPGLFGQATPHLLWWDATLGVVLLAVPAWFVLVRTPMPRH